MKDMKNMKTMKNMIFAALLASGFLLPAAYAVPAVQISGESKNEFKAASMVDSKLIQWVDGGVKGKCFRISCPANAKKKYFHFGGVKPSPQVTNSAARIRMSVMMKGKGKGNFGFSPRTVGRKPLSLYRWESTVKEFEIDSPDKWVKLEYTYVPQQGFLYARGIRYILPGILLYSGSDIYFDDFTFEFIETSDRIVIEK